MSNILAKYSDTVFLAAGSGSPEGVVTAGIGSCWLDLTNGITYVKNTGTGNTGWMKANRPGTLLGQMSRWNGSSWALVGLVSGTLADANATKAVADGNQLILPAATLTTNRTLTLSPTGATLNEAIEVERYDVTANTYAIINGGPGGGTLYTFPASQKRKGVFIFDGTNFYQGPHVALNAQVV